MILNWSIPFPFKYHFVRGWTAGTPFTYQFWCGEFYGVHFHVEWCGLCMNVCVCANVCWFDWFLWRPVKSEWTRHHNRMIDIAWNGLLIQFAFISLAKCVYEDLVIHYIVHRPLLTHDYRIKSWHGVFLGIRNLTYAQHTSVRLDWNANCKTFENRSTPYYVQRAFTQNLIFIRILNGFCWRLRRQSDASVLIRMIILSYVENGWNIQRRWGSVWRL